MHATTPAGFGFRPASNAALAISLIARILTIAFLAPSDPPFRACCTRGSIFLRLNMRGMRDLATRREGPAAAAAAAQHSQSPSCNFMRAAASALIPFSFRMPSPSPNANNNQRGGAHSASDKRLDRCEANNYSYR